MSFGLITIISVNVLCAQDVILINNKLNAVQYSPACNLENHMGKKVIIKMNYTRINTNIASEYNTSKGLNYCQTNKWT